MSLSHNNGNETLAVGLMSGTSADGIDAVVIAVRACRVEAVRGGDVRVLAHHTAGFDGAMRRRIAEVSRAGSGDVEAICRLNFELGEAFAQAAWEAMRAAGCRASQVAVIGSHGQTIHHLPPARSSGDGKPPRNGSTLQIGEPSIIAARTGVTTVADFRPADIAAGGQGAPLVPWVDWLLWRDAQTSRCVQNIGGMANVTWLPAGGHAGEVIAFDSGPGNALIDAAVRMCCGGGPQGCGYDRDGRIAAGGRVREPWLRAWLGDEYFARKPPKSTGPERFGEVWLTEQLAAHPELAVEPGDLVATLTALTVETIAGAVAPLVCRVGPQREMWLCGGGAHNPVIVAGLRKAMAPLGVRLRLTAEMGLAATAKEAMSFALLGLATLEGQAGNLPSATGASQPVILGKICPAPTGGRVWPPRSVVMDAEMTPARVEAASEAAERPTETINPETAHIDEVNVLTAVDMMMMSDAEVFRSVASQRLEIAAAVEGVSAQLRRGGRLIYVGAGTSGRLGVLDAAECPPTFGTQNQKVQAVMAGGPGAVFAAVEGAEDDVSAGEQAIAERGVGGTDAVVGITASGGTPFVMAALKAARRAGAFTVLVACAPGPSNHADVCIRMITGAEVIAGSTRLKAGTATKMALNMISTLTMVRLGKVHGNLMVDLRVSNNKLWDRGIRLVQKLTGSDRAQAEALLKAAEGQVKVAIVMGCGGLQIDAARQHLANCEGHLRTALDKLPRQGRSGTEG